MTAEIGALILAAGKGTRMKSELPKVIHPILGKPMAAYVVDAVKSIGCTDVAIVTGYKSFLVKEALKNENVSFIEQTEQLGTGHAVQCHAKSAVRIPDNLLVVCGDTPLISVSTLRTMMELHLSENPAITMMTLNMENPGNYGRIIRDKNGTVAAIREAKDCSPEQLLIKEVNLAVYLFNGAFLKDNIFKLKPNNKQSEYYLTDLVEMAAQQGKRVLAVTEKDESSTLGINSRQHLAQVSAILQKQLLEKHMDAGVTIVSPENTLIGPDVTIGRDTVIYPDCMITGKCKIGTDCEIGPNTHIHNSTVSNLCRLEACIANNVTIPESYNAQPFSVIQK